MLEIYDLQSTSFYIKKLSIYIYIYIYIYTCIYIYVCVCVCMCVCVCVCRWRVYMYIHKHIHTANPHLYLQNQSALISSKLDHSLVTYKSQAFYIHEHTVLKVNCLHFEKVSMNYLTLFWTISHFYRSKHVGLQHNVYCLLFYVDGHRFNKMNCSQSVHRAVSYYHPGHQANDLLY